MPSIVACSISIGLKKAGTVTIVTLSFGANENHEFIKIFHIVVVLLFLMRVSSPIYQILVEKL